MSYFLIEFDKQGKIVSVDEGSDLLMLKDDINFCKNYNIEFILIKGDVINGI